MPTEQGLQTSSPTPPLCPAVFTPHSLLRTPDRKGQRGGHPRQPGALRDNPPTCPLKNPSPLPTLWPWLPGMGLNLINKESEAIKI